MNEELFQRTAFLVGQERMHILHQKHICVFGVGGVGGHTIDALVRSGIGEISIVDHDCVTLSNINRQYVATINTKDCLKVDIMKQHLLAINPDIKVHTYPLFYLPENADEFPLHDFDYIIDAIDTVSAKVELISRAKENSIPIVSAMGCGNRLDPTKVQIDDLFQVTHDSLAKVMRHELRKKGIFSLDVVHSIEAPIKPNYFGETLNLKKKPPGSSAFVPSVAGITLAYFVITKL
ncbi:ThiF family adenylyltransferase [Bulleidia sp. zg-1006]|uniref:tRNA threonylcarbamoyladenosine dehydratase n=1 Tax=Bulleidia sp. zg-1006 TaxID=2806552 RepID=UPI0019392704|nr:tRNA threonylcarbamoyladenosine dehydratase [Bulleidia sp. zg-1006]QRG86845.1 tRNA threonylcarbamoyladenosine dehydratase [Bulleidia sp. zg-1006]